MPKRETAHQRELREIEEEIGLKKQLLRKHVYYYGFVILFFGVALGSYFTISWLLENPVKDTIEHDPSLRFVAQGLKTGLAWMLLIVGVVHTAFTGLELLRFTFEHQTIIPGLANWAKNLGKPK